MPILVSLELGSVFNFTGYVAFGQVGRRAVALIRDFSVETVRLDKGEMYLFQRRFSFG